MTTYRPIEVLLADDHEIFRDGFGLITKFSVTAQEEDVCGINQRNNLIHLTYHYDHLSPHRSIARR